jgi:hypothetical protein
MNALSHPFLDLASMEALRHVRLRPRGLAEGTFSGPHKSHYRGTAVEFADYRQYVPGDDIRLVDWKVFARTDRHCVRLFEAERNLLSYVVVDKSGSMDFSGIVVRTPTKYEYAARMAAALGYLVVSDFLQAGPRFWNQVDLFRRSRFDVMLFHVMHPEELALPEVESARFAEMEGGKAEFVSEPEAVRENYVRRFSRFVGEIRGGAEARGCDWFPAQTSENPYRLLQRYFLERGSRR